MLVSIIVPAYNAGHFIEETIRSILKQSYTDWELLICDDGSSPSLEQSLSTYLNDPRIHYSYKRNSGVSDTRNFGFQRSKGDCIVFLDADDLMEEDFLKDRVHALIQYADVDYTCSAIQKIDEKNNLLEERQYLPVVNEVQKEIFIYEPPFSEKFSCPSNYMFRRKICDQVKFNKEISSAADRLFLLEVDFYYKGMIITPGNNKLLYRITGGSMSNHKTLSYYADGEKYFKEVLRFKNKIEPSLLKQFVFGHGKLLAYGFLKCRSYAKGLPFLWRSFCTKPGYYFKKLRNS